VNSNLFAKKNLKTIFLTLIINNVMRKNQIKPIKLNLGCANQIIEGWVNVDYALGARLVKNPIFSKINKKLKFFHLEWDNRILVHDLCKRFPFENNSVDIVYTSHTLEHFTKEDGFMFLKECYRVLKKDGIIRVVVPDLEVFVDKYIAGKIPADEFVKELNVLSSPSDLRGLKKAITTMISFPHKCMYDHKALLNNMREVGFDAKRRLPFDSNIDDIRTIELESRTHEAVIVEGIKLALV
jgi:predicted SAM-dependent methyltransferase